MWCRDWPVRAFGVSADEPVAVLHANRVVACTPAARRAGVVRDLRRREAQGRCPGLEVMGRDMALEARRFEPVVAALSDVAPLIEVTRPGRCAIPTRGPSRYFGGDRSLVDEVVARVMAVLHETGIAMPGEDAVRVGVADGDFAAGLAARSTSSDDAGAVIGVGGSAAFLAPLSIATLERPELVDVLGRLGIRTLGAVADMSPRDLIGRFGPDGVAIHRLASGLDLAPPDLRRPPDGLDVAAEIDPPAERVEQAAFVARGLSERFNDQLDRRGLACVRVMIEAETEHGEELARCWRHEGSLDVSRLVQRVRWQLDGWLNGSGPARGAATTAAWGQRPTGGISRLRLVPDQVIPATGRQMGFWGGERGADERVVRSMARVQALLGVEAVQVPSPNGGRSHAEQLELVPVEQVELEGARQVGIADPDGRPWPGRLPAPSPTLVHSDPIEVGVLDAEGRLVGVSGRGELTAPPARVAWSSGSADVVQWCGPWPVDERWWDGDRHRRRARFQLVTSSGAAVLVSLEGGKWWIEASYA